MDSPYGDWGDPNTAPPTHCLDKDYVTSNVDAGNSAYSWDIYTAFPVQPPAQTIDGISSNILTCGQFDGSTQTCKTLTTGTIPFTFNFDQTFGKMYGRYVKNGGGGRTPCSGIDTPMTFKAGAIWYSSRPFNSEVQRADFWR